MLVSAALVVFSLRARGADDWYMPIGLYLCVALLLRGYFFKYYHGGRTGRFIVTAVLLLSLVASALLWEDKATAYRLHHAGKAMAVDGIPAFHFAALLHGVMVATLFIHSVLPRRWLQRATDDVPGGRVDGVSLEPAAGGAHIERRVSKPRT